MSLSKKRLVSRARDDDGPPMKIVEENNNEVVNMLAAELAAMGSITDKCKVSLETASPEQTREEVVEYDYEEDEFDEDDVEEPPDELNYTVVEIHAENVSDRETSPPRPSQSSKKVDVDVPETAENEIRNRQGTVSNVEIGTEKIVPMVRKASSNGTLFSASSSSRPRRLNMSFTNDRAREIHRENLILMRKVMKAKSTNASQPPPTTTNGTNVRESNSAVTRRRLHERTNYENLILLRKLQGTKPSYLSFRR